MPIYEYECRDCRASFELLMRSDTKVECPSCESTKVVRKLSVFAAHVGRHTDALPACATGDCGCDEGRCGSGLCGMQ
ncbi:MAG: zinc ribbon domain-containing protein [Spirochaetia bacterium]|jgi:putative FmdB family regulatory protein